ncbi:MAG: endonuclease/exonuclease/phosphatase family protein [Pirellula sp.]
MQSTTKTTRTWLVAWSGCLCLAMIGCDVDRAKIKQELAKELEQSVEDGSLQKGLREVAAVWQNSSGTTSGAPATPGQPGAARAAAPPSIPGQFVSASNTPTVPTAMPAGLPTRSAQTILVASYNIQAFGEKKIGNRETAEKLAAIIGLFDVVAIQEVRATDQSVIPQLLKYINARGARYDFILGPRLGRTVSKEQYCYIFDTTRIVSGQNASYTVDDRADLLHREPLVARFLTRAPQGYRPFSFSLVDIHTDPDEVKLELPVMHTVLQAVREYEWSTAGEDDVILMGDLNAGPNLFGNLAKVPNIYWTIRDQPTNTRRTQIYDNMLFDRVMTNEFVGRAGVLDVCAMFRISTEEALKLSDHFPIWAEFTLVEQPSAGNAAPQGYAPAGYPPANNVPANTMPANAPPANYATANNPPVNYSAYPPANYQPANAMPPNNVPSNYPPGSYPPGNYPPASYQAYPPADAMPSNNPPINYSGVNYSGANPYGNAVPPPGGYAGQNVR